MKIKKNIRLSDSYYSKSEIEELYSKGLIDIRDYSDIKKIDIKDNKAYLNRVLIDHCDVYCSIDGAIGFDSLYIYQSNLLDKYSKLKYLL